MADDAPPALPPREGATPPALPPREAVESLSLEEDVADLDAHEAQDEVVGGRFAIEGRPDQGGGGGVLSSYSTTTGVAATAPRRDASAPEGVCRCRVGGDDAASRTPTGASGRRRGDDVERERLERLTHGRGGGVLRARFSSHEPGPQHPAILPFRV